MKYLAVKAKSLIQSDDQSETPGRENDAIRNLSSLLERQVASAVASSPQIPKTGFDSFPPSTKRMILFVSEKGLGRTPTRPVQTFADILALSNVAYVKTTYTISCATRREGCIHPNGFLRSHSDRILPSRRFGQTRSLQPFCCGPQTLARSNATGRDALDHASTLVQMQLKATDTTTGFSDKDIKSMTKLNFTIPRDFHQLARLLENMAGWPSSSSPAVPVDAYVGRVVSFPDASSRIDLSDVTTASSRRQLGRLSPRLVHRETHATILGVVRRSGTRGRYQRIC
ncbi:hypothetical protein MHU86_16548 [Fragilaria crotonensis]|nr:hypothetical protein MHU86_16548 [Fragilaria crotonensis]